MHRRACWVTTTCSSSTPGWFAEPGKDIVQDFDPAGVPSAENPGGRNITRWVRDDVGEWLAAGNTTPDVEERRENFCNIANALREDVATFPLLQFSEGSVYANRLHGYTVEHLGVRHLGFPELVGRAVVII